MSGEVIDFSIRAKEGPLCSNCGSPSPSSRSYFEQFTSNTSLHGLKYTGERELSKVERIWWAIMVALSMCICGYLITKVLIKWQTSPVIVTFAETPTSITQLPFPAVTICPTVKSNINLFNFTEYFMKEDDERTEEDLNLYNMLGQFCVEKISLTSAMMFFNESYLDRVIDISLSHDDVVRKTRGFGPSERDSRLFQPFLTPEGMCFTSNMLRPKDIFSKDVIPAKPVQRRAPKLYGWALDEGYWDKDSPKVYPRRAMRANKYIVSLVHDSANTDHACSKGFQGFKVALHAPNVLPPVTQSFFWATPGTNTFVSIKPAMITTSPALIGYEPERRQCFFSRERKLAYFREYTRENCEFECLTNATLSLCDCVTPMMPRIDASTPFCGFSSKSCLRTAMNALHNADAVEYRPMLPSLRRVGFRDLSACGCLPSCTQLTYETSVSRMDLDWENRRRLVESVEGVENSSRSFSDVETIGSHIVLTFHDPNFITSRRSELYGVVDFLANCGGLLGVCMGFSILSLIEIFYFFVIRVIVDLKPKISAKN